MHGGTLEVHELLSSEWSGTPNKDPEEYSRKMIRIYLPSFCIPTIFSSRDTGRHS